MPLSLDPPLALAPPPLPSELSLVEVDTRQVMARAYGMLRSRPLPEGAHARVVAACAGLRARGKTTRSLRLWVHELAAVPDFGPAVVRAFKNATLEEVARRRCAA